MRLLGSLLSLPYIAIFFVFWIAASISKPLTVLTLVCVLSNPAAAARKAFLFLSTLEHLILSRDKTWRTPSEDPDSFFQDNKEDSVNKEKIQRKTIIFVRHGESTWNDTFNKGDRSKVNFVLYFIPNLIKAIVAEWYFWVSGQANESWFFDAPLSEKGLSQARTVQSFLQTNLDYVTPKEADMLRLLIGDKTVQVQLVSSNLRRAISTMVVGFQDRLEKDYSKDNILILPALQEISRNPDALSITPARGSVVPAWTDPKPLRVYYEDGRIDTSMHTGNKPVTSNGLKRMQSFVKTVFQDISKDAVIVGGHSLWFRSFFRTYLPRNFDHVSKKKKLVNGGVVGFVLEQIPIDKEQTKWACRINPKSLVVLHGGF